MADESFSTQDRGDARELPSHAGTRADADNQSPAPDAINIQRILHQSLRGRYVLAAGLGIVCAVLAVLVANALMQPSYRSEALIRIAYEVQSVIPGVDSSKSVEAYDAFMQSQQALLSSRRVMDLAARDPGWKELGVNPTPEMMSGIATDLTVERKSGAEHIRVAYDSDNPAFAATVVRSVVDAYSTIYNSMDTKSNQVRLAALESRRDELSTHVDSLEEQSRRISAEFGSSSIDKFYDAAVQRLSKVESALIDVRIALALTSAPTGLSQRLSPQQIARFDATMARYLADREAAETRLEELRLRGYGEEHKQVLQATKSLETAANRIRDYAVEFQNVSVGSTPAGNPGASQSSQPTLVGRSAEELKADQKNLADLNDQIKKQLQTLGNQKTQIEQLRGQIDRDRAEMTDIAQKLASARMESAVAGRMSVVSPAEVPVTPVRSRRMQYMAMAAMSGLCLPAAGFVAMGLLRRRYRYSDDAVGDLAGRVPLLGILPLLPHRLADPDSAADAAQCVHQIRVMLQVHHPKDEPVAYMVTSACPGEGKTSLTAALAMSFAISGASTLLVDADLIGQRLTRGFKQEKVPGFRDMVRRPSGDMHVHVVATGTTNLSLLPCGVSDGRDACAVSARNLKKVITAAKKKYDVVLVDSGPILGSLEASVMAGVVDGVVLTISREQGKPMVDRAINHLRSVGARVAGMVFNKAERRDFQRSVGASSLRSVSAKGAETTSLVKAGVTASSGFGSLVDSVQTYLPGGG